MKNITALSALVVGAALAITGCGGKQKPVSQTTVRTQTSTETDQGDKKDTQTTDKVVDHQDGTQTVDHTTSTQTVTPPPSK